MDKLEFRFKLYKYFADGVSPSQEILDRVANKLGITNYKYLDAPDHGATGVAVQHPAWPDTTFVMFNGTYPKIMRSDLSDLDVFPRLPLLVGLGHRGFTEIAGILGDQIPAEMLRVGTVDVVGHSMGAGVASIFCVNTQYQISELTLLALPPSLNLKAHRFLLQKVPRITSYLNANDAIYWTTPWPWFRRGRYTWVGKHGWFHGWNTYNHIFKDTKVLDFVEHGYVSAMGYDYDKL